ncbi:MAG: hypothetical protein WC227_02995 [Patescibacteria group bacterium]
MPKKIRKLVTLLIDGFGVSTSSQNNAVAIETIPNFQFLWDHYPRKCLVSAIRPDSTEKAKCFDTENSYLEISLGYNPRTERKALPDLSRSTQLQNIINIVRDHRSALHLFFVLSNDDSQSSLKQLLDLIKISQGSQVFFLYIHILIDNSFKSPSDLLIHFEKLEAKIKSTGLGEIVSIVGELYLSSTAGNKKSINGYLDRNTDLFISGEQAIKSLAKGDLANFPHCTLKTTSSGGISDFDAVVFANHNNLLLTNFISFLSRSPRKPRFVSLASLADTGIVGVLPIYNTPEHLMARLSKAQIKSRLILPDNSQESRRYWLNETDNVAPRYYPSDNPAAIQDFLSSELDDFFHSDTSFLLIQYSDLIQKCQSAGFSGCANSAQLVNLVIRMVFEKVMNSDSSFYIASPYGMAENLTRSKEMAGFGFNYLPTPSNTPLLLIEDVRSTVKSKNSLLQEIATSRDGLQSIHKTILKHFQIGETL